MSEKITYAGRTLLIVGKHKKEQVIAPVMEQKLGVRCVVASDIDTDLLGTFTGEVERKQDVLSTLRAKCALAAEQYPYDLIIASEGSFGMHPNIPLVPADDELLICMDRLHDIEYIARKCTVQTNFSGMEVHSISSLMHFAQKAKFPEHALILRRSKTDNQYITKGITDEAVLRETYAQLQDQFGQAYVETDMRAMYNPTRMQVIGEVAHLLADKINSRCPICEHPGFSVQEAIPGLPCGLCGTPTNTAQHLLMRCAQCGHTEKTAPAHGKHVEDPQFCDFCNP